MESVSYDIVINGGGMVGAALACALGDSPLRVAVLESRRPQPLNPTDPAELRVSAIGRASQRLFVAVGAWEAMTAQRVSPFREMRVWDAGGAGSIHFDCAEIGEPGLGWIIENRAIQWALLDRLEGFQNVDLLCPAALEECRIQDHRVELGLASGRRLSTRLLVGADGGGSRVRTLAGIATRGWDYSQKGVVCVVATELPHQETAWQRFLPGGPLAFLPLADGRCSIVWSTGHGHAEDLLALDDAAFAQALGDAFDHRLGGIIGVGPRAAFPLRLQHAMAYTRPRVALVGDAAHVVHPLAGQGVNLGLLDAAALAEVLLDAVRDKRDPGSLRVLRRYERWRKGENVMMLAVMDGFKRLFGNPLPPVAWLRNLGLGLTDAAAPLKHRIIRRAMGLSGDLPRRVRADPN